MASMLRGLRQTSVKLGRPPVWDSPLPTAPRPTGPSAGVVRSNGHATFANELRPAYDLGQLHPNPGRPGGGTEAQATNQSNPNRYGARGPLPGDRTR